MGRRIVSVVLLFKWMEKEETEWFIRVKNRPGKVGGACRAVSCRGPPLMTDGFMNQAERFKYGLQLE